MGTEDRNFYLGSFFLTFGVMLLTVIPLLANILDLKILIDRQEIYTFTLLAFVIGCILYITSLSNFKRQIVWIISLILFFLAFQFCFIYFKFYAF